MGISFKDVKVFKALKTFKVVLGGAWGPFPFHLLRVLKIVEGIQCFKP